MMRGKHERKKLVRRANCKERVWTWAALTGAALFSFFFCFPGSLDAAPKESPLRPYLFTLMELMQVLPDRRLDTRKELPNLGLGHDCANARLSCRALDSPGLQI